jgi:hypothetical protein
MFFFMVKPFFAKMEYIVYQKEPFPRKPEIAPCWPMRKPGLSGAQNQTPVPQTPLRRFVV